MKPTLLLLLCLSILCQTSGCTGGLLSVVPVTVRVKVLDPDGVAVEGATVYLSLPRYGEGGRDQAIKSLTDRNGVATVSGIAQQDYTVSVGKPGYYHTSGPHRSLTTDKGRRAFGSGDR